MRLNRTRRLSATVAALAATSVAVAAQQNEKVDLGPLRTIAFETDQGTWMNVDVSPDGRSILFDLLGDIYIVPIAGGDATLLLGGREWDTQPRCRAGSIASDAHVPRRLGAAHVQSAAGLPRDVRDAFPAGNAFPQPRPRAAHDPGVRGDFEMDGGMVIRAGMRERDEG